MEVLFFYFFNPVTMSCPLESSDVGVLMGGIVKLTTN